MDNITYLKSQKKQKITLNDYISAYYDSEILEVTQDMIGFLSHIAEQTIIKNGEMEYHGRINEYGNFIENVMVNAIKTYYGDDVIIEMLGTGYPDLRLIIGEKIIYPELKISSNIDDVKSRFRVFYTSTPEEKTKLRKNIQDGYHILFHFEHSGPGQLTGRYKVTDLCNFEYMSHGNIQQGSYYDIYSKHDKIILRG